MVTGFPYYPRWRKQSKDEGRLFARGSHCGIDVYRGYLYVPNRISTARRLWHELTFCLFAGLNFIRAGRPDVIVIFTPPFFLGMVGVLMKWIWRRPLVINIQDLPIDAALALGMVKRKWVGRILLGTENWIYRQADQVATISRVMCDNVRAKGVSPERVVFVPNWIDVDKACLPAERGHFLALHPQATGKFIVAYAGNLGVKQGVDLLLRVAKRMEVDQTIHFFVIGDGADKPRLLAIHAELHCSNVTFLPFLSHAEYSEMLSDVDMVFVAQRSGAGDNFLPSKLLGLMARSKPLLVAADPDSELAQLILGAGCGVVSPYGDVDAMAENLQEVRKSKDKMLLMGRQGLERVREFDRDIVLYEWRRKISELVKA